MHTGRPRQTVRAGPMCARFPSNVAIITPRFRVRTMREDRQGDLRRDRRTRRLGDTGGDRPKTGPEKSRKRAGPPSARTGSG